MTSKRTRDTGNELPSPCGAEVPVDAALCCFALYNRQGQNRQSITGSRLGKNNDKNDKYAA
jgi:hypothetical protein